MTPKKIFIISAVVLAVIILFLVVYNFFINLRSTDTGAPTPSPESEISTGKVFDLSQEPVVSPVLVSGDKIKYYRASDGQVFSVDFDGRDKKAVFENTLAGFIKALWNKDASKVIGLFSDSSEKTRVKKYFYDYKTEESVLLNENTAWVCWDPEGKKIAYEFLGKDNDNNISVANPDGTNWKNIFPTRLPDWQITWVTKNKISLATPPSGTVQGLVYALDPETSDFSKVLSDYFGLKPLWSPSGDKILFSATQAQGKNLSLLISDEKGGNKKELSLTTLVDKCVWSANNNSVFCAVPQAVGQNAIWPDDYYKGVVSTKDDFYEINFATGQQIKLFESTSANFYDAASLLVSDDKQYLFFVNQYDSHLYGLKL